MTITPTQQAISALLAQAAARDSPSTTWSRHRPAPSRSRTTSPKSSPRPAPDGLFYEPYLRRFAAAYGTHLLATITTHVTGFADVLTTARNPPEGIGVTPAVVAAPGMPSRPCAGCSPGP